MKIAVRGGHNFSVKGASGLIDETIEDRKVKDSVIKYLKSLGHNVIDVTAPDSYNTISSDLVYGVDKANNFLADLFISIHFNNAYSRYDGSLGTEILVYSLSNENKEAKNILNKVTALGFKNRGVKERSELYELRKTVMNSVLIEVCFVEATDDVNLYKKVGFDSIGKAIAEGITFKSIDKENQPIKDTPLNNTVVNPSNNIDSWILNLQKELNKNYNGNLILDGIKGPKTLGACPVVREGLKGNLVKLIQDRLIWFGFSCGSFGADGVWGSNTTSAVRNFQKKFNLIQDGIIGNNTWRELLKL